MPYTDDFISLKKHFARMYNDKAKAETFAFKKAFKENIRTFEPRKGKYKKNGAFPDYYS